ncbi:MAG: pseudouridine synthase [Candidatus Omnitrophota bacterium]
MKKIRLQVALAKADISSRRKAVELIEHGHVEVNGEMVKEKGFRVDILTDDIRLDGKRIIFSEKKYYYMLNKPTDVLSTASDDRGRKTVLDLVVQQSNARLYPVGRLDKDTTGLLLLTNDGELTYRLTHPKFEIDRVYEAKIKGLLEPEDIRRLEDGIEVDGEVVRAERIVVKNKNVNSMTLKVTLREGRKRQVRNMFKAIGYTVVELSRISYGPLTLNRVEEGEWRALTDDELIKLKTCVGLT